MQCGTRLYYTTFHNLYLVTRKIPLKLLYPEQSGNNLIGLVLPVHLVPDRFDFHPFQETI
jgi:hypothetical protein